MRALPGLTRGRAGLPRIVRIRETGARVSRVIAYSITGFPPAGRSRHPLALWRAHWLIQNRLHWRRDVILREDHSSIRSATPQAMTALRDAMLHIVRDTPRPLAETCAICAEHRHNTLTAA